MAAMFLSDRLASREPTNLGKRFERILDDGREETIHRFIAKHPQLLSFLGQSPCIWSKYSLAGRHVTDFLSVADDGYSNSPMPVVTMVEIERRQTNLYVQR
jgi:hypothetical protein